MGLHWLPATALKTPMSVYLTLVLCANSTSLTSSCSLAFIVDEFPRLPKEKKKEVPSIELANFDWMV